MSSKWKWAIGSIVVLAIVIGLGRVIASKIGYRLSISFKGIMVEPLKIKTRGSIAGIGGYTILTTPNGENHYIIVGSLLDEVSKKTGQALHVLGRLSAPPTSKVNDMVIRGAINVARYDTNDFTVESPMFEEMSEGLKRKIKEQSEQRTRILKKLGLNDEGYEVISGKLEIIKMVLLNKAKEIPGLLVKDKYGDQYVLTGQLKYPYQDYAALSGQKLDVVVVGSIQVPDPTIMPLLSTEPHYTFAVKGLYNNTEDLSEVIVKKPEEKTNK